jgi:hypothetical protein
MNLSELISEQMTESGKDVADAYADGKLTWPEAKTIGTRAIGRCIGVTTALGETGDEVEETVVNAALHLWDNVIVPYNIPVLPEFAERMIENTFRNEIPGLVKGLLSGVKDGFESAKKAA